MVETLTPAPNIRGYVELARRIFGCESDEEEWQSAVRGTRRFNRKYGTVHREPTLAEIIAIQNPQDRLLRDRLDYLLEPPHQDQADLLVQTMDEVIGSLHGYEQRVLQLRFKLMQSDGLEDFALMRLEDVGRNIYEDHQVTRERARQIEAKALRKLRHPSRSRRLRLFPDEFTI